jgi:hypothetical protein
LYVQQRAGELEANVQNPVCVVLPEGLQGLKMRPFGTIFPFGAPPYSTGDGASRMIDKHRARSATGERGCIPGWDAFPMR